jgi:magnesium chelatase subunit D
MSQAALQTVPDGAAEAAARWADALEAAELFAIDPVGLGGVVLRGGPGWARDQWMAAVTARLKPGAPLRRMPASIEDDRLLGGLDLAATLSAKRPVIQSGLLSECDGGVLVMPGAERIGAGLAARIGGAMGRGEIILERDGAARRLPSRFGIVVLDEGANETEMAPPSLSERCAFRIALDALDPRRAKPVALVDMDDARARLADVAPVPDAMVAVLVNMAEAFGVDSLGAVYLAMRAARVAAARAGRVSVTDADVALAARLVLGPRATRVPAEETAEDEPPPPDDDTQDDPPPEAENDPETIAKLEDMVREAVQTALPDGLLEALASGKASRSAAKSAAGGGKMRKSPLRGRPLGTRGGSLRPGIRLALVDTLRAAAPWQGIRRADNPNATRIEVRSSDFRIRRFAERREATIVFAVDASGSAAFHRLAEAKGAVELLLAEAYASRTHAALIAFRGTAGEVLLPPTRSLARARALLADLPGGGGTPLAAGLEAALLVALGERGKGRDAMIVVLTDGSANIAHDGTPSRPRAMADGLAVAQRIAAEGIAGVFIDNSPRPRAEGAQIATAMGARYVPLPYLDAGAVSAAVRAAKRDAA